MYRNRKPPRLWLRKDRGTWIIRYGGIDKYTGFWHDQKHEAEVYLNELINSPGDMEHKLKKAKRKPGVAKSKKIIGHIYFISRADCRKYPIKIGFSFDNVYMRLKNIQVGSPYKLALLATVRSHYLAEIQLHSILSSDKLLGEWFNRGDLVVSALEAAINGHLKEWMDAQAGVPQLRLSLPSNSPDDDGRKFCSA